MRPITDRVGSTAEKSHQILRLDNLIPEPGKTVREWLKGKSWKEQYEFGLARLNDALGDELR